MMKSIFMYLFLFMLLLVIFQYKNEKNIFEFQKTKIENLESKVIKGQDSIKSLNAKVSDLNYFTLQGNEDAMKYLKDQGYNATDIEKDISKQIYDQNLAKGDNPLVPFDGVNGDMKINKLKFLNHKWILANFTDGTHWGEMILKYSVNDKKELTLNKIASFIYPN